MNAQISFIDGQFSLIHIPLPLYSSLLKPILQMLLPHDIPCETDEGSSDETSLANKHGFLNISVTPIECSIVCHTEWATRIFQPVIDSLPPSVRKEVHKSKDSYMVFSVSSAGMEAGQRVMDLTAPLAMAGIPIFFITTYYTDFILVPTKDHSTVIKALLARGFEFSETDSTYVVPTAITLSRGSSSSSEPPSTPPPTNVAELQTRTFSQLRKRQVVPFVVPNLNLAQCSGKRFDEYDVHRPSNGHGSRHHRSSWLDSVDSRLYMGLVSSLTLQPRFLSVTFSADDAPSLLLDKSLLPMFGDSIAGDTEGDLVPIFLDLVNLPLESTGIVCGVAGKLVDEMRLFGPDASESELSYLSTARAGAVILSAAGSTKALDALQPLLEQSDR